MKAILTDGDLIYQTREVTPDELAELNADADRATDGNMYWQPAAALTGAGDWAAFRDEFGERKIIINQFFVDGDWEMTFDLFDGDRHVGAWLLSDETLYNRPEEIPLALLRLVGVPAGRIE